MKIVKDIKLSAVHLLKESVWNESLEVYSLNRTGRGFLAFRKWWDYETW